jgi:hypothetical protein
MPAHRGIECRLDFNVLIDPARRSACQATISHRLPFNTLLHSPT